MGKILKKRFLKIRFHAAAPMIVGSGMARNTDNDVARDSRGLPYIPGSAVAGVIRDALKGSGAPEISRYLGDAENIAGTREEFQRAPRITESRLVFYDATMDPEYRDKYRVSVRDGVGLNKFKNVKRGAKFDLEVLEPGVEFVTYAEQNVESEDDLDYLPYIVTALMSRPVSFGAKSTRGYGRISDLQFRRMDFDFTGDPRDKEHSAREYLDFNMYDDKSWKNAEPVDGNVSRNDVDGVCILRLGLQLTGGISIRKYTAAVNSKVEHLDFQQLTVRDVKTDKEIPVVPGTSWAGAFRHQIERLSPGASVYHGSGNNGEDKIEHNYFGLVSGDTKERSDIYFSESQIRGGSDKILSRSSIDRFTGGAANGALFTEQVHYGGSTELEITFHRPHASGGYTSDFLSTFAAACADLHEGILPVGGETSIGRGVFRITDINGKPFSGNGEEVYHAVCGILKEIEE